MNKVIIIGGRGTSLNIADHISDAIKRFNAPYEILGFANDVLNTQDINYPVVCDLQSLHQYYVYNDVYFIYSLYKPGAMPERVKLLKSLMIPNHKFINFIHPAAIVSKSVNIGTGNVVFAGTQLLNTVSIGSFNIFNSNAVIEHDTKLQDCNFLAAGCIIGSNVTIGEGCFIGLNSTIRENVTIDDYSFIGMGSVVVSDTDKGAIAYGNPARKK